jgi:Domain of unknown function (DUF3883)
MANSETERRAIEFVMQCELAAGRVPEDVSRKGAPFDISSPPRKIEVKAFGGSARGAPVPLEERQVREAASDPANFFLYVVDNVTTGDGSKIAIREIHGNLLSSMIGRTTPHLTYWPTLRVGDYDGLAPRG